MAYLSSNEILELDADFLGGSYILNAIDAVNQQRLGALIALQQGNMDSLNAQAQDINEAFLDREMAGAAATLLTYLSAASPYDTGTLQSAHRGFVDRDVDENGVMVVARFYIDPTVENPVNPGRPVVYGERLVNEGKYENWFEFTASAYGEQILDDIGNKWLDAYEALWRL